MNNSPTIKKKKIDCEVCHCGHEGHDCPVYKPSEEKDQYGHKIIRPTLPDDTFEGLKEEIKERASEEKECTCFRPFHNSVEGIIHQKDCPLIAPEQEEWEEKIYDLLSTTEPLGKGFKVVETDAGTANEIIDLIRQLLKKEREKVIEEVKKNTKDLTKYETEFTCPCGQEHSVQFLIRKPKVMKGKITEITINSQQLKK